MKKIFLLLGCLAISQISLGQSTITIGPGSSVSVGNGSLIQSGYRDGTMLSTGSFNLRSITFDPVAIAATSITASSFNANWNASAGASGYKLDISTDPNFGSFVGSYQSSDVGNVTSFNVTSGISGATTYYYRIRAYDIDGITGYSNTIIVITAPAPPVATAATNINESSFNANWGSVTGAASYRLDVSTNSSFTSLVTGWSDVNVGNVTTYSVTTNLSSNTTYYYRVRAASSSGGLSNYSNTLTVLVSPLPPSSLAATPITQTSFTANWGASVGATKYYLDVSTTNTFASYVAGYNALDVANVTFYSVSGLIAGTTYYYRVRSSNGAGISTNSTSITELSVVATTATSITQTSFSANWNASSGATNYFLDVSTDANFTSYVNNWQNKSLGNVTSYTVNTDLLPGTTYYYRIRAINGAGDPSSNSNTITVQLIPPNPVTLAAVSMTQLAFDAKWDPSLSSTGYYLDVATDAAFNNMVTGWNNKSVLNVTSYTVNTNLASGNIYYYRVRAANAIGTSNHSDVRNVTLIPPDPVATAANNVGPTSFTANWNPSTGATNYSIDIASDNPIVTIIEHVDLGNVSTYTTAVVLGAGTNYYYRVKASNASGASSYSNIISLTSAPPTVNATAASNSETTSFSANWDVTATATGYLLDVSTDINFGSFVTGYNSRDVGAVTTFSVASNLSAGTTYYYRLKAYNVYGTGVNSNTITYATKPANPNTSSPTSITSTSFNANWISTVGATGYYLDVSTASDFSSFVAGFNNKNVGAVTTYNVSGLTDGLTYYYRVRAYHAYSTSDDSDIRSTLLAPPAPTSNAVSGIGAMQFTANWQSATGATGYYLYVSTDSNFGGSFVSGYNGKDVGNVTSSLVSGLTSGTTYYYRIKAYNAGGSSAESGNQTVLTLPAPPVIISASGITATAFNANWTASNSATGYKLDVSTDQNFGAGNFLAGFDPNDVGNVLIKNVSGLSAGITYYYRVKAYNGSGTDGNSSTIKVVTIPAAPTNPNTTSITYNSFVANWTGSTGANGYYLDVNTDNGFGAGTVVPGYGNIDIGNVTNYTVSGLLANTQYYYQIRAYNFAGTSGNSTTGSPSTAAGVPKAPSALQATNITSTSFSANWILSNGATSYRIDVSTVSDFSSFVSGWNDAVLGNVSTCSVNTNINAGIIYYYRIRAVNGTGTSGHSSVVLIVTRPSAPLAIAATGWTNYGFTANWNSSTGATGYKLDVLTADDSTSFVTGYNKLDVGSATSFFVNGLVGGTTYYYRVWAYNTGSRSTGSNTISRLTNVDPSGTVNAISATAITSSGFDANWNSFTAANGYKIDVSTVSNFSTFVGTYNKQDAGVGTSYSVSGLSGGTVYYYRIKAYTGVDSIAISGTVTILTKPASPTLNAANSIGETSLTANWNVSTGATGYYLDVATDNGFTSWVTGFQDKYVNSATSFSVTGLSSGVTYYYRVRSKNGSGISSSSAWTSAVTLPPEPAIQNASSILSTSFTANWSAANSATGYKLDVATNSTFTNLLGSYTNVDVVGISNSITGLTGATTYYYRVRALNGSGTGNNSTYMTVTTSAAAPSIPTATVASNITQTDFTANWNSVAGATKYYLDLATTPGYAGNFVTGYQDKDVGNVTSIAIPGLTSGINYYYQIRAYNANGTSLSSGTISVITVSPDPIALPASSVQTTSFIANWNSSNGATKYYLDVASDIDFTSKLAHWNNVDVGLVTSFNVNSDLSANSRYYYRVKAQNSSGTSNYSGTTIVLTGNLAPVATSASSFQETSFIAGWNSSAGADGYILDVSTLAANFTSRIAGFDGKDIGNVTSYTVTGLLGGTDYVYRVRAYVGGRVSDNSNTVSALTKSPAPVASNSSSVTSTSFSANWNTSTGAAKYYLEVSTLSDFSSFLVGFNPKDALLATTYSVTSLNPSTTYYYRIKANNASGNSSSSNIITVLTAPAAPTALAATSITNTTLKANWNSSSGATGYRLEVSTDPGFGAGNFLLNFDPKDVGNVNNYTVTNLNGGITYYYRVRAYNSGGEGGNSNTITTTSAPDPSPAPVAADATAFTQTSFSANWTVVASATGYRLDVATDNGFTQFISGFENLNVNNVLIYSVTGLAAGTTYYYRVRSYNAMGVSSNSTVITALTKPVNPTSTCGTSLAEQSFNANWNSVASATNYFIDVSTNSGFTAILAAYTNAPTTNVTTFSVSGLTGGTTYYYRIRSYNASGSSGDSGPQTVLTVPAAPVALAAGSITQTSFSANWNSSVSATKYFLDVSADGAFGSYVSGYQNLDVGNVTTLSVSGLTANTSYYYRVRALNASGVSANSTVIKVIGIPTATAATSITLNSFEANWDEVTGATAYRLDVSDDSNFSSYVAGWQDVNVAGGAVITKLINTGLTSNKRYYFRLRATDGTVTSTSSNNSSVFTAPTAPVATAADTITSSSFWTHWNAATSGATGYKLDVSTDSNFGPGTFVTGFENRDVNNALKSIVKTIEFSDTVVYSGTTYYCRIRAYNSGAESVNSNVITLNTRMNAPTIKSPSNVTASSFTAKWNPSTGATKYYVDVATDLNFTSIIPAYSNLDVGNVDTLNVSGLIVNSDYFYRVRAYNLAETTTNSAVLNVKTSPLAPVASNATLINSTGFTANWTPQGGSSPGYLLDVATDAAFSNFIPGYQAFGVGGTTNTEVITTMTTGNPYFYRVRAYTNFSESANSNVICAAKQATEIRFKTIDTTSYKVSFKASASSGKYIVVRGTGSLPVFVPVDGTTYTTGVQGVDKVVYVGTDTLFTEQNILTNTLYYYNIYNYHLSAGSNYYVLDSPLPGSNQIKTGFTPTAIVPTTDATTTTFFPSVGVAVTFNNGTTGTTLNVIKETETPTTGIGLSSTGVNQLEPLSFNIHSTNASPGSYDVVLDFSPLGYSDWSTYKVLKRSDENSQWLDVTQPPINAVITNRATDGIPGKFTISGLSSFSQFVLGRFVNVVVNVPQKITVLYPVGGEKWKAGTIQTIAWNKSGNFAGVKMEYSTDGGVTWTPMLNEILVGLTYYPWKVPSGFNSDKCKIRVSNWDNPNIFDISPVTFSINDPSVPLQKLGDINNDGLITAFDASLVLQYVVGIITFNDAQRIAADVNNDGSIGANDAARILIYTINGTWSLGKTKAVSGQIVTGAIIQKEKSELFIPLKALNLSGVNSIMISLDLKNVLINSIEYENKLSENWIVVSSLHDSKFTIAMVSINEMDNELLGNLCIKFKEAVTKNPIAMLVQLNDEEMVTYEIDLSKEIPTEFSLSQNFPNPFNPTTTIRYQIPKTTYVQLKMYDGLGREVETLVSEEKIAGNYEVKFDGRNHSSGIYFYQLRTDSFTDTKKFVLIK